MALWRDATSGVVGPGQDYDPYGDLSALVRQLVPGIGSASQADLTPQFQRAAAGTGSQDYVVGGSRLNPAYQYYAAQVDPGIYGRAPLPSTNADTVLRPPQAGTAYNAMPLVALRPEARSMTEQIIDDVPNDYSLALLRQRLSMYKIK